MTNETVQTETAAQPVPAETAGQPAAEQVVTQGMQTETVESLKAQLVKVEKALKDANKEAADRRKRLEELEKADAEHQKAKMTEAEKQAAHMQELEKQVAEAKRDKELALDEVAMTRIRYAVVAAAAMKGFNNPDDAFHLGDMSMVEVDDNGKVKGIDEMLDALAKTKPYMLKQAGVTAPTLRPNNPANATEVKEMPEQRRARLYGMHGSFLDPTAARQQGGGVLMSPSNPKQQPQGAGG